MKASVRLQRRSTEDSNDRLVANLKPRGWSDPIYDHPPSQSPPKSYDFSHVNLFAHSPQRRPLQAKLTVGKPNDVYEQEADRVADQVMAMPEPAQVQRQATPEQEEDSIQTKPLAATITPVIQRQEMAPEEEEPLQAKLIQREAAPEEEEPLQAKLIQREAAPEEEEPLQAKLIQREVAPEEEEPLQAKLIQREAAPEEEEPLQAKFLQREAAPEEEEPLQAKFLQREAMPEEEEEEPVQAKSALQRSPNGSLTTGGTLEGQLSSSKGNGTPLPEPVRAFMEPRFGADFSQVRVHTGSEAVQMNQELGAQAFTHGQDIYYGAGKAPDKDPLTGHELTHVLQQTGPLPNGPTVQRDSDTSDGSATPAPTNWTRVLQRLDRLTPAQRRTELLRIRARGQWSALLSAVGDQRLAIIQGWLNRDVGDDQGRSLESQIRAAHNSDRGQQALALIDDAIANRDPQHRITSRLRELLALGVALPKLDNPRPLNVVDMLLMLIGITPNRQQDADSLTQEGVLTIAQVERAINALIWMPRREYTRLSLLLTLAGDRSRLTQSFLLLEAVAARADRFDPANAATRSHPGDLRELERFARAIRHMEQRELIEQTSVAQTTGGSAGLTQKFTDSCGPTSAQLIRAEADPIEAFRMHQQDALGQDALDTATAREQEASLERNYGQTAVPRGRATVITAITNALPTSGCTARQSQAVLNYLNGLPFSGTHFAIGIAKLERSMGGNFPGADALRMVRESVGGTGPSAGLTPGDLTTEANSQLDVDSRTGRPWQDLFDNQLWTLFLAAGRQVNQVNMTAWGARVTALLNQAAPLVERGNDVTFIVYWNNAGGHFMVFTDVRTVNGVRRFLVHDPWTGTTQWMTQPTILAGGPWPPGGNGLICGLQG